MGMVAHGLCISGEVVQAVGTDEAKVVVHGPQVIHLCSLILTLFATPGVEGQATSSLQGLGGMDLLWPKLFGDSVDKIIWKKWMSFGKALAIQLVPLSSFWLPQLSCTSWTSVSRRLVEVAIWQKMDERSYDPSCSKLAHWAFW